MTPDDSLSPYGEDSDHDEAALSLQPEWGAHLLLDQDPAAIYLASLNSENSRRVMLRSLTVIASAMQNDTSETTHPIGFPWGRLRYQHTQAIRSWLIQRYKPATVNKMLSALRGVLKQAWMLGYMSAEEYHRAAEVKNIKGETVPTGRELQADELERLITVCLQEQTPIGLRDGALIALMYGTGMRRAEVVALNLEDYDSYEARLLVRGKGRKERNVYVVGVMAQLLSSWIEFRGDQPGALFYPAVKGGKFVDGPMSDQAVYNILRKRADQAGVRYFSPHDMRRTFVSDLLDAGADIATVAKMAGHANVQTTARYDRRPEETKRQAAELLHINLDDDLLAGADTDEIT
ncbi:MAG: tyrosine-type recombinase/integrase [Chloroflexi bacterium]|nr:tyrosine-type recombinase/integrase [Chloroflexota bacterium]